jgi:transcriptional regulator
MYVPTHFAQNDHTQIIRFIEEHSFATLCSVDEAGTPFATHLPLLLADATPGAVILEGHMARANPQWRHAESKPVAAIFHGPHHYISPSWYAEPNLVPTWNYLAVHASGTYRIVQEPAEARGILARSVETYEAGMPSPWQPDEGTIDRLLGGIVGFRIEVNRLEGKWKLNQNHTPARRQRVIAALDERGGEDARAIAAWMRRLG